MSVSPIEVNGECALTNVDHPKYLPTRDKVLTATHPHSLFHPKHSNFAGLIQIHRKCLVRKEKNSIGSAWPSFHKSDPSCHCSTGAFQNTQQHKQHQHDFLPTCSKVFSSALPSPTVSILEIYNLRLCKISWSASLRCDSPGQGVPGAAIDGVVPPH